MTPTEHIWREYHTRLHGFIRSRVDDNSIADDILQDVFIRIHTKIHSLKQSSKIQHWIYQITRNAIVDYYRTRKKTEALPHTLAAPEPEPSDKARQEMEYCIQPVIQSLPEHYRQALMLSEIEGLTQKEVAERQGISVSGAKARVQRGRRMVKDILLRCSHFEFDHRGQVIDYGENGSDCKRC